MFYTLEYLDEDANIEILRYDTDTKNYEIKESFSYGGGNYTEPGNEWIYLCIELEEEKEPQEDGSIRTWSQMIGKFRPEIINPETNESERVDGCKFVRTLMATQDVPQFMTTLISSITEREAAGDYDDFVEDYKITKKEATH